MGILSCRHVAQKPGAAGWGGGSPGHTHTHTHTHPFGIPPPWRGHGSRRNSPDREPGQSLLCHGRQALRLLFLHQALTLALLPALPTLPAQRPPGRGDALPCGCPYVVAVPCPGGHVPQAWDGLGSWHRAEGPPAGSACVRRGCCACPFQLGPTLAG